MAPSEEGRACVFCRIAAGVAPASLVYQDAHTLAFMNQRQANPGHVLVIPTRHIATLDEMDDDLAAHLARAVLRVARAVRAAVGAPGLVIMQFDGVAAGQDVFHLHVHILPRHPGDAIQPLYAAPPPIEPRARLAALAAQIKRVMSDE